MAKEFSAFIIIPITEMRDSEFAYAMDIIKYFPATNVPRWKPLWSAPLFSEVTYPEVDIDGFPMRFDSSSNINCSRTIDVPDGFGYLEITIDGSQLNDLLIRHDDLVDTLHSIFLPLNHVYLIAGPSDCFDGITSLSDLLKPVGSLFFLNNKIIERLDPKLRDRLPKGDYEYFHKSIRYTDDILERVPPEHYDYLKAVLIEAWTIIQSSDWLTHPYQWHWWERMDAEPPTKGVLQTTEKRKEFRLGGSQGNFVWCYYPENNHTLNKFEDFYYLLKAAADIGVTDETAMTFRYPGTKRKVVEGMFAGYSNIMCSNMKKQWMPDVWINSNVYFLITSGSMREYPMGDYFTRDGAKSSLIWLYSWRDEDPQESLGFFRIIEIFARIFKPIYGYGHYDIEQFSTQYHHYKKPPERKIWAYNMFDLAVFDERLRDRLSTFHEDNVDDWDLRIIDNRTAILRTMDPFVRGHQVPRWVTHNILGKHRDRIYAPKKYMRTALKYSEKGASLE